MKKLLIGLALCASSMLCAQNTLYDGFFTPAAVSERLDYTVKPEIDKDLSFMFDKDEYRVKVIVNHFDTLVPFVNYYNLIIGIYVDSKLVNVCIADYSCINCPNSNIEWLKEATMLEWDCLGDQHTLYTIINCKRVSK